MLLDDRFVEAQREDVVAHLSARHKEQSSHELHPADSSWVGALQSQAPRVALSSWGNGTAPVSYTHLTLPTTPYV